MQWEQWQALQLQSLEKYKKQKYGKEFKDINSQIEELIKAARLEGNMSQEIAILKAIKKGWQGQKVSGKSTAEFFKVNDRKLDALIKATTNDLKKAEIAILRRANDQYRKIIFNAQVYANTGAGTYEQAVDMATKDMLSAGLKCVEYSNGARHTLADYADMAIRTAAKRAYLTGEGEKRQEWGIATVIVNKRGNPCPKCLPFVGKVLIDDVWSGGSRSDGKYPLMSAAVAAGLYHPRCKDSHTTYFPGISTDDDTWTKKEIQAVEEEYKKEQRTLYAERQAEKYDRLAHHSLDPENKKHYQQKEATWRKEINSSGVNYVGKINPAIYESISPILNTSVIITDKQLEHILDRHPKDYNYIVKNIPNILADPDFIIKDKHENTGLVIKQISAGAEHLQAVLRVANASDPEGYQNSIISCWKISDKRLQNYLRNKTILYKKE